MTDHPDDQPRLLDDDPTLPDGQGPLFSPAVLRPGQRIAGRYVAEARIGSGGGSVVWRAFDESLARTVALKVLRPELAEDPAVLERFRAEAGAPARVIHPGLVGVFDTGVSEAGPWLALEHVDGPSLLDVLRAHPRGLDPMAAAAVVEQAAGALGAAHAQGLVHRDVKPANLLVTRDGVVKVSDFGSARSTASERPPDEHALGTPGYAAPERLATPAGHRAADPRMDVYSLGVVLHECLTGRPAFPGRAGRGWVRDPAERPLLSPRRIRPDVPRDLDAVVARATASDPADRYPDATALAHALRPSVAVEPLELVAALVRSTGELTRSADGTGSGRSTRPAAGDAAVATDPAGAGRSARRLRWRVAVAAAVLAGLAGVGALTQLSLRGTDDPDPGPTITTDAGVPVAGVRLYDPYGSVGEDTGQLLAVVDGDPATSWATPAYPVPLRSLGTPGVGVWIDLGEPRSLAAVTLTLDTPAVTVELLARERPPATASTEADWAAVARAVQPGATAELDAAGTTARHWLVWFTELEPTGAAWQAVLVDVRLDPTDEDA